MIALLFHQVFENDFAYDDGTAEKAYALTAAGGKVAVRYELEVPDTLLGLAIHFTPYYTNSDDETFLLRAWEDNDGVPGDELIENYQFHSPQYFNDGFDLFAFYEYDDPIPVDGYADDWHRVAGKKALPLALGVRVRRARALK